MSLMEKTGTPVGSYAPDFELPGIDDQVHHLSSYLRQLSVVAVVFISNQCPYSCFYIDRLKQIQTQFCKQGFTLVGINAMDANQHPAESFQNMKKFALERQLNFPYLWDPTQDVARSFGAQKTPEAFLIDDLGILRYSGQIDDNVQDAEAIQMTYLQNAIAALLAGEEVMLKSTEVMGCPIQWRH